MLGHLPRIDALAGVALAGIIFSYIYWGFGFLRMGTTGLTAKAHGAGDQLERADVFYRGLVLAFAIASLIVAGRSVISPAGFWLLQGPPEVELAGQAYFQVRILGAPAVLGLYVVNGWLIGRGLPKLSLLLSLVLNAGNIALDAVFIYYLGWGAYGAGLATTLTTVFTFLLGLVIVWRVWDNGPGFATRRVFDWAKLKIMLALNADIMVRTLCVIFTMTTFTNLSAGFGKVTLASNTILMSLLNLASYFIDGYAYALEAIAGRCAGAGDADGVRRTLKIAVDYAWKTGLAIIVVYLLATEQVLGLLTSHQPVLQEAVEFMPYLALALVFSILSYVYDGLFIGLANGRILRSSMVLATACFVPLAWWAHQHGSATYLWVAMVVFMAARTGILLYQAKAVLRSL